MRIKSIEINNYRSIQHLIIPFDCYGEKPNDSNTVFLVGINESGKSAILEAINLIQIGAEDVEYEKDCFLEAQEKNGSVEIFADMEIKDIEYWRRQISEKLGLEKEFTKLLNIKNLRKYISLDNEFYDSGYDLDIEVDENLPLFQYVIIQEPSTVDADTPVNSIKKLSEANAILDEINKENAESFLMQNQKLLSLTALENIIVDKLEDSFESHIPRIQFWKSSPEYLINDTISLEKFKEDTSLSIPLRNIFHLFGKTTDSSIKETIERALKNQARRDELQNKISSDITKHVNKIWKEHKIKIRVSINGKECQVHVEDKDKEFTYYTMNQRSDGFKQFISLILSLSTQNASKDLNNNIILIDEPEVHLHPSGVRYMRDEILKIGKNNIVFVATHSQYMVDTDCMERHYIISKEKTKTRLSKVDENTHFEDDTVLMSAFGLNLFKELLPKNILIVEGSDDKSVISHAINLTQDNCHFAIKVAKGASKTYGIASLLSEENVSAFFLFDDDKEGRDYKNKIIENYSKSFSERNTFTLKDICTTLPSKCTLEDLFPLDFVKSFFEREIGENLTLDEKTPFLKQIIDQTRILRENKDKLDHLKIKLAEEFKTKFSDHDNLVNNAPKLIQFIKELKNKLNTTSDN